MKSINTHIDSIFNKFRAARELAGDKGLCNELEAHLAAASGPHISVAFEGAAAGLAYRQLQAGTAKIDVPEWPAHAAQVHIGIGWAIAEMGLRPDAYLNQFTGVMQGRVMDGFGYYSGLFRRRRCIHAMDIPEGIPTELLTAFDQGLGRAMWYICKGEIEPLVAMIGPFPEERKAGIWRGIGVASSYVGGMDADLFMRLHVTAHANSNDLLVGTLLCAAGRIKAMTDTEEVIRHMASVGLVIDDIRLTIELLSDSADYATAMNSIRNLASAHRP